MTRWQWLAVAAVLGVGILLQIPRHTHRGASPEHAEMDHAVSASPGAATVVLAVSGMT